MHLVALKAHAHQCGVGKTFAIFSRVYGIVTIFSAIKIFIVKIQRKSGIVIIVSYLRSWPSGFGSSEIKEAYLIP